MSEATTFTVNGVQHTVHAEPDTPLLYILRNDLKLKGAKFGCGIGLCGSCTVLLDGHNVMACDTPLWAAAGKAVTTIEGLGSMAAPHVLQQAFITEQAAQCGYCISGVIMSAAALLARNPDPSATEIKQALARNLCRCGSHTRIIKAIQRAARGVATGAPEQGSAQRGAGFPLAGCDRGVDHERVASDPCASAGSDPFGAPLPPYDAPYMGMRAKLLAPGGRKDDGQMMIRITEAAQMTAPAKLPGSLNANRRLDRWLRFNADRSVTIYTGKVELGQGIVTALAQIAAEELDVTLAQVRMVSGDTALAPDEGQTAGSRSIDQGGSALRYACAEARHVLLKAAAQQLDIPADKLSVQGGVITGLDRIRKLSYWDLPHAELLNREATAAVKPKAPSQHTIVGASAPRLDIPAKATGTPQFIQDLELPGMLFGRVVRPPSYDAQLIAFDADAVRGLPGVVAVVKNGNFIGVIAEREEQAVKARQAAQQAARWKESPLPTDDAGIYDYLTSRQTRDEVILARTDAAASGSATRTLVARYSKPYIAHAALGPSCALARVDDGRVEVWTHSQGVYPLRDDLASVLDIPPGNILVHHAEGAGCYGHNGADDAALDAVLLARAVPTRPVQVQWMRDDEFAWEPYGPAMVIATRGALDADGNVVDWALELWSNGHSARPNAGKTTSRVSALLAAWHLEKPAARQPAGNALKLGDDGMTRNAPVTYDFPCERITAHRVEEMPLRVSSLRSLGAYANVFAVESFIDELAAAAGADPVEFRLRHLKDARARAVIELAAQKAGWQGCSRGELGDRTSGRGVAFAQYKNSYGYLALVIDLGLEPDIHVIRAVAAADVGQAINPDGIANQIEGGIIQALSWTLREQVKFDRKRVTTRTWEDYPILTFAEVPSVEVHLINRPDEAPLGAGEMAAGPTAAAIANALYDALGVRIRDLPLTRERIAAALA